MKFLMFINHAESSRDQSIPKALNDAMGEFVTEGFQKGWLKDTAGLKRTAEGFRIRSKGGKLTQTDGPFTESKEVIGGFAVVQVRSKDEAIEWASRFAEVIGDVEVEVRQLDDQPAVG